MGTAYRASGRVSVMDGLAIHPYPDNSSEPGLPAPRSTSIGLADYEKLVALLGSRLRRDGAGRLDVADPVRRVRDRVGRAGGKRSLYSGTEPATTKPVDESKQAAAYDLGLRLAFCQPNVAGMLLFHSHDEKGAAELAVGGVLRGRLSEGQPLRGA